MKELDGLRALLGESSNLAISRGGKTETFNNKGVASLMALYGRGELKGAYVADSIVGKAAAVIMAAGGVRAVYAALISELAVAVFENCGIYYEFSSLTPAIINRAGDGPCPMESAVKDISDPYEGVAVLKEKLRAAGVK